MMKCLITGATGLVGAALWKTMLQEALDYELYLVCSSRNPLAATMPSSVHVIETDLALPNFTAIFPQRMDVVLHLAQSRHFREFPDKAGEIFAVNTVSTLQILDYCRQAQVRNVIIASSGGVYGVEEEICHESAPLTPHKDQLFYATSKQCAEALAGHYEPFFNVVILRPFFIYGSTQQRQMLIPRLIDAVRKGQPVKLQGKEGLRINPIHVLDAVRAILAALQLRQSEKINLAGPQMLTLRRLCEIIGAEVGITPLFDVQEGPSKSLVADITRMQQLLWTPQISFVEGLRECLSNDCCFSGKLPCSDR